MPDSVCGMGLASTWRARLASIANANCEVACVCVRCTEINIDLLLHRHRQPGRIIRIPRHVGRPMFGQFRGVGRFRPL